MTSFFRKRPPYQPRTEHSIAEDDDLPVIGPASEDDDFPVVDAVDNPVVDDDFDDNDFPIVGPASDNDPEIAENKPAKEAIPIVTPSKPARQFSASNKIKLPQTPEWVQQRARQSEYIEDDSSHIEISPQLENAIQTIISDEMKQAEQRIKQKILLELQNHIEK